MTAVYNTHRGTLFAGMLMSQNVFGAPETS